MKMTEYFKGHPVVLASGSPRRKELLEQIGIKARIRPSVQEEKSQAETPEELVMELAAVKAQDIAAGCESGTLVIGADTVVVLDEKILGKPQTPERAVEMIQKLQGREHQVYTGVTVILCMENGELHGTSFAERTNVELWPMTEDEISTYAQSGEPIDKAGAYGIQGSFAAYIKGIQGDYTNVVGLPLGRLVHEMNTLLTENGGTQDD